VAGFERVFETGHVSRGASCHEATSDGVLLADLEMGFIDGRKT
jgi:hypothetical protein